jgi:hypothetical protein
MFAAIDRPREMKATPRNDENPAEAGFSSGAPSGFRTPDPLIKSQLLYQLS